jgi:hypothetical protein
VARTERIAFRTTEKAKEWVDQLAEQYPGVTGSDVARHALVIARRHEAELKKQIEENS